MWAVVVAAGSGTRLGADGPKAFVEVAGRRLVDWALDGAARNADRVVAVVPAGLAGDAAAVASLAGATSVVGGADTRSGSVRCGLGAIPEAGEHDVVVIHDAARPLASDALYAAVVAAVVAGADGAVPGVPVADTLKRVGDDAAVLGTVERDGLVAVQTPQAFRVGTLRRAHAAAPEASDDAGLVEAVGGRVVVVPGDARNRKVTTPDDLALVAALLAASDAPAAGTTTGGRPLGGGA